MSFLPPLSLIHWCRGTMQWNRARRRWGARIRIDQQSIVPCKMSTLIAHRQGRTKKRLCISCIVKTYYIKHKAFVWTFVADGMGNGETIVDDVLKGQYKVARRLYDVFVWVRKKKEEWFRNDEMFSGLIRSALFATHHSLSPSLSPSLSIGCLNRKTGTCSFKSVRVWLWANDVCSLLRVTVTHPLNFAYQRWQCILYVRVQTSIDASRWCHGIGWLYERKFFV